MAHIHARNRNRSAFTLVELLIVILIIAILVSLLVGAIVKVMDKIPEVQTRTEITELETALQAFMNDYQLSEIPPSYLILNETAPLSASPLDNGRSAAFLQKVFGKNLGYNQSFVDWNGDGSPNGPWVLEGEQCLIFYLGGIPNLPPGSFTTFAPQGFSTNNINPSTTGGKRRGPYFPFQTGRLASMQAINAQATLPVGLLSPYHPVYLDPWRVKNRQYGGNPHAGGWPYAYFSTFSTNNGYNQSPNANHCASLLDPTDLTPVPATDPLYARCQFYNTNNPVPYASTQYLNSNTYQIISAGKDGVFGSGSLTTATSERPGGADDQSNFSSTVLGAGQN